MPQIQRIRSVMIPDDQSAFWDDALLPADEVGAVRILVCGNAGVGKSTLINQVFGKVVVRSPERSSCWTSDADDARPWIQRCSEANMT